MEKTSKRSTYQCPKCKQKFSHAIGMIGHAWSVHGIRIGADGSISKNPIRERKTKTSSEEILLPKVKTSNQKASPCSFCDQSFDTDRGRIVHESRWHSRQRLEREIKNLQKELDALSPPPAEAQPQQVGEPMVINCCSVCGHDVRTQNAAEWVAQQALLRGERKVVLHLEKEERR